MRHATPTLCLLFAISAVAVLPVPTWAEESADASQSSAADEQAQVMEHVHEVEKSFNYQEGHIVLPNQKAELDLTSDYVYLGPDDTRKVIEDIWNNPPGSGDDTLGMILPKKGQFGPDTWGAVLTYKSDGHISDKDANEIDYAKLLQDMKKASEEESQERQKAGYGGMRLVGWAVPPHYDAANHVLHWAKEFRVTDGPDALNYDVRVLGREGVLSMIVVASKSQLDELQGAINGLPTIAHFTSGNRYSDFNKDTDKVAEYGLAALVAGGAAVAVAKAGKLALLLVMLKKFGVVLVGAIAVAWKKIKGVFGAKTA